MLTFAGSAQTPIAIHRPTRVEPVDFRNEVLPILQANCLPCHNKTTTKADLLLETPADMLRGGESGPAIVAGNAVDSLLLRLANHTEKPRMPPRENKVNAVDLTPEELGLLARWIDDGASEGERRAEAISWLENAPPLRAIYSIAWSTDGNFVACGRGQRAFIYHRPTGQMVSELTLANSDRTNAPAHRDLIGALAFRPDGLQVASGGFREVKLWRRVETAFRQLAENPSGLEATNAVRSPDGSRAIRPGTNGVAELFDAEGKRLASLYPDARAAGNLRTARSALNAAKGSSAVLQKRLETAEKEQQQQTERLGRARESQVKADELVDEKRRARDKAVEILEGAEVELATLTKDATDEQRKPATQKLEAAKKTADEARKAWDDAIRKQSVSAEELRLAEIGLERSRDQVRQWKDAQTKSTERMAYTEDKFKECELAAAATPAALVAISSDAIWVATAATNQVSIASGLTGEPIETWDSPDLVQSLGFGHGPTLRVKTDAGQYERDLLPRWEIDRTLGDGASPSPFADRISALAYSPDGSWLAVGSGEPSRSGDVTWWDPTQGTLAGALTNLHSDTVLSLAFSPDSGMLSSAGADRMTRLVDLRPVQAGRVFEGHTGHVLATAWKEDSTTLATGGADLSVKFWDSVTGEKRKQAVGFEREVTGLAFLSGDRWVACGSNRELRIINENGERIRGLTGIDDAIHALAVTTDGRWIAAGGEDGVLRIWNPELESPQTVFAPPQPTLSAVQPADAEPR